MATGAYAGANYICADAKSAAVVYGGNYVEVVQLTPGLHVITNADMDDPRDQRQEFIRRMLTLHTLDSAVTFLAVASRAFSRKPDVSGRRGVVLTGGDYGTVSSTLLSLHEEKIQQCVFQYAPGPPSDCSFDDLSALLRQVLSTDRSRQKKRDEDDIDDEYDDEFDDEYDDEFEDEIEHEPKKKSPTARKAKKHRKK